MNITYVFRIDCKMMFSFPETLWSEKLCLWAVFFVLFLFCVVFFVSFFVNPILGSCLDLMVDVTVKSQSTRSHAYFP